jgi:alpha-beta hydrolase superfamily lysophospholipase
MLESAGLAWEAAGQIAVPSLVLLGEDDPVINPAAIRRFHDRLGCADRTLVAYPGMRHEPFNELGRETVYADLAAWLDRILNASGRESPALKVPG